MPMIGAKSMQYSNGDEGKARRRAYGQPAFSHAVCMDKHVDGLAAVTERLVHDWQALCANGSAEIVVDEHMMSFALRSICFTSLGGADDATVASIRHAYDIAWHEMEQRLMGSQPTPKREEAFRDALQTISAIVNAAVARATSSDAAVAENHSLLAKLHQYVMAHADGDMQIVHSDFITFLVGGFHTTGNALIWMMWFLLSSRDVYTKVRVAVRDVLGDTVVPRSAAAVSALLKGYVGQVINETLRCSALAPWAARVSDSDVTLDSGIVIPAHTPIVIPLGVALLSNEHWRDANVFDPSRFAADADNIMQFKPFGFAGGRVCPGADFARIELAIAVAALVQAFDMAIAANHSVPDRHFGLVTRTSVPIRVRVQPRTSRLVNL